jgi:hypothetical protein
MQLHYCNLSLVRGGHTKRTPISSWVFVTDGTQMILNNTYASNASVHEQYGSPLHSARNSSGVTVDSLFVSSAIHTASRS